MKRRRMLELTALGLGLPLLLRDAPAVTTNSSLEEVRNMQASWRELIPSDADIAELEPPIERSAKDWQKDLPQDAYRILFKEDTEAPFSSPLNDEKRAGVFVCRACALPLFTSTMKYDSETGWPSFFTSIPEHFATKTDFKLIWPRTEYHCAKCGGHQGHVFDDGPQPTRQRWCNNGLALRFIPAAG